MRWMCHGPGRAGGRVGAGGRSGAAADHGRHARHERLLDLLRADEVDVRVEPAGGDDHALARDDLGGRADDDVHPRLDVGVAGFADAADAPVLDADVGLDDAPVVDDQRVGDHRVGDLGSPPLALAHAVADHLAAAELHLLAVDRAVLLHLDPQVGVGQAHLVARGRAEHLGVGRTRDLQAHQSFPITLPRKPYTIRSPASSTSSTVRLLSGLEAHGGAGRDVQTKTVGRRPIEGERFVGLVEVVVRADLDRPVAGVGHFDADRAAAGVQLDLAGGGLDLSWNHFLLLLVRTAEAQRREPQSECILERLGMAHHPQRRRPH